MPCPVRPTMQMATALPVFLHGKLPLVEPVDEKIFISIHHVSVCRVCVYLLHFFYLTFLHIKHIKNFNIKIKKKASTTLLVKHATCSLGINYFHRERQTQNIINLCDCCVQICSNILTAVQHHLHVLV